MQLRSDLLTRKNQFYGSKPDFKRLLLDCRLADMDSFIMGIYTASKSDMFPIVAKIISRTEWGARPPKKTKEQKLPVEHMVVTWTYTDPCMTKEECIEAVQELQAIQMKKGADDIEYNFLIGGDGNLYEGRGWKTASHYSSELKDSKKFHGNSIQVAFINKPTNKPTYFMLKAVASLFAIGEEDKYVVKNVKYSRIVHNEIMSFLL